MPENPLSCFFISVLSLTLIACSQNPQPTQTMFTIADARSQPAQFIDNGTPGDSVGDILVFDQPLLDKNMKTIGNNSGTCIRTRVSHSFQCQWTLTFGDKTVNSDSIQVAGREFDKGKSNISIIGGTGKYAGISGELISSKNKDGSFNQVLYYRLHEQQK